WIGEDEVVVVRAPDVHDRCLHRQAPASQLADPDEEARERAAPRWPLQGFEAVHRELEPLSGAGGSLRGQGSPGGRTRLRRGGRGRRYGVRIEAEALPANPDDVGPPEDPLPPDALLVHERTVGARVHE